MFLRRKILDCFKYNNYLQLSHPSVSVISLRLNSSNNLSINDTALQRYLEDMKKEYWELKTNSTENTNVGNRMRELFPVVKILEERNCIIQNLLNLNDLGNNENDKDMIDLVKEEKETYQSILNDLNDKLLNTLVDEDIQYGPSDTIIEVSAGVGGQEAMLFAKELFTMYINYANLKKWNVTITEMDTTGIGGVKKASATFSGSGSYELLKNEGGVHRVQRIPATEKAGRLHTSTVTVAILLQPSEIELDIPDRDLKIETKRSSGAGGQHVNTTDSAVRITHLPTGMTIECQKERSQIQNRKLALSKLRALLYQQQQQKLEMEEKTSRKSQVGLGLRNEKIRTYNYQQDRITDHRIGSSGGTVHNIETFMNAGENLEKLLAKVRKHYKIQTILEKIQRYKNVQEKATSL